jgi:hypothetical protein
MLRTPDGLRPAGDAWAGMPAVASPGGTREPSAFVCISAVEEFRNQLCNFAILLFNFDAWTKSAKTPMNSQKSRLLKVNRAT